MPWLALPAQQLTATELSLGAAVSMARRTFAGAEVGLAHRPSAESRIGLTLAGGGSAGTAAARAQLTLQILVNPAARSGAGLFAGLGTAFLVRRDSPSQGYLALVLGLEGRPGSPQGWYVEGGLGGGVRIAAGWRGRRFPRWWSGRGRGRIP